MKTAVIIGAGPAGLTAAYELLMRTDIKPVIFEMTEDIGGISRTVNYKGNRMDIGGHRFFSKSDRVMDWWQNILQIQGAPAKDQKSSDLMACHAQEPFMDQVEKGPDPETSDLVMLIRNRLSRIFYSRKFFPYPISFNAETIKNLGIIRITKIGVSYIWSRLFPIRKETSLEIFLINRFGKELYLTFFKDYTEKVWGVRCDEIPSEWGAQRIKGLSVSKAAAHAVRQIFTKDLSMSQKKMETSLIEKFLYPKYGPGQLWEEVARIVQENGGQLYLQHEVVGMKGEGDMLRQVVVKDKTTEEVKTFDAGFVISSMPVKELISSMHIKVPENVQSVAAGLQYRDFITVGLLLDKLIIQNRTRIRTMNNIVPDNWIYIQEKDVKLGRLQIFNNWSPYMVKDETKVWIGLEYFCNEGDDLWLKNDDDFARFAIEELARIKIIDKQDILDHVVIRVPKTYPAYFGTYGRFDEIRDFTDNIANLFLIGRNGMHKYNNQDHSMLTAMQAVDNIIHGTHTKDVIWAVNTEEEYHEEK